VQDVVHLGAGAVVVAHRVGDGRDVQAARPAVGGGQRPGALAARARHRRRLAEAADQVTSGGGGRHGAVLRGGVGTADIVAPAGGRGTLFQDGPAVQGRTAIALLPLLAALSGCRPSPPPAPPTPPAPVGERFDPADTG